ncbi:hypothetical protein CANARDRAFT_28393 [[Candida] arabinofermentans NRRL YB-2248]|uniref:DUF4112 domain-containing protein n=1 Tax=[Candida] arabinofermentans NRRL YB-2248 TaxID=983967 RepID=A0A1E4T1M6_9ASCO|nr:hypothetical protein CANARDRAFT_28393 [[Candida] arabinofermentans NRRL YB-2248]
MSQLIYKYLLKKTGLSNAIKIGNTDEDPYTEIIPNEELSFWQKKGAKRRRKIPTIYTPNDQAVLRSVQGKAYHLDLALHICGMRIGWGGIIGLIPAVGDIINLTLSMSLINKARQIEGGLPPDVLAKMTSNVIIDFLIGLIPFVGDFINIAFKANTRNFQMLERFLKKKYEVPHEIDNHAPGAIRLPSSDYEMLQTGKLSKQNVGNTVELPPR